MPLDYKKEYKELYIPKEEPVMLTVPPISFIMVDGTGDPNNNILFQEAVELLYGLSFTIKMSHKKGQAPQGYFEYIVPPLEGLWWVDDGVFSLEKRDNWLWTLMIRQPEFVTPAVFQWACDELNKKRPQLTVSKARLEEFEEGLCVQVLHIGPYATETYTMAKIEEYIKSKGLRDLVSKGGRHHEIYLSDPRRSKPENNKTVLRHPVEEIHPVIQLNIDRR